jgi:hypothetical protein
MSGNEYATGILLQQMWKGADCVRQMRDSQYEGSHVLHEMRQSPVNRLSPAGLW